MPRGKTSPVSFEIQVKTNLSKPEVIDTLDLYQGSWENPYPKGLKLDLTDDSVDSILSDEPETPNTYFIYGDIEVPMGMANQKEIVAYIENLLQDVMAPLKDTSLGYGENWWVKIQSWDGKSDIGFEVDREMSWEGSFSPEAQEFMRYLKAVVIVAGEGSIELGNSYHDTVSVAIVHDGSGYNPGAAIFVDYGGREDAALESAYEILEEREMESAFEDGRMEELEAEWTEYEGQAYDILTETFDGRAWTLDAEEAAEIIEKDKYAIQYIDISEKED